MSFKTPIPYSGIFSISLFIHSEEEKTLYLIGDPKQSIYRFRKADLYTYLKAKHAIAPENHFVLDTNFRSSKEFLTALNHLFLIEIGSISRKKKPQCRISPFRAERRDLQVEFQRRQRCHPLLCVARKRRHLHLCS